MPAPTRFSSASTAADADADNALPQQKDTRMDTLTWVVAANAAVWLGLGAYLALIGAAQRRLAARLAQLELLNHD